MRRFFSHERTIAHHHASEVPATGFAEWEVRQKDFAPGSHQIAFCALFRHCRSSAGCGKLSSQLYSASVNPPFSDWLQTYERPLPATFQNQCADVVCAQVLGAEAILASWQRELGQLGGRQNIRHALHVLQSLYTQPWQEWYSWAASTRFSFMSPGQDPQLVNGNALTCAGRASAARFVKFYTT